MKILITTPNLEKEGGVAKVIEHEGKLYAKEKRLNKDELAHIGL